MRTNHGTLSQLTINKLEYILIHLIMSELGANNGSDLIVDFGHRRPKRTSASNTDTSTGGEVSSTNNTTAMSMDRQVSFSEDVTAHCIAEDILREKLENKSTDDVEFEFEDLSKSIADEVKEKIKASLNIPRYKVLVQATIGTMKDQGVKITSR